VKLGKNKLLKICIVLIINIISLLGASSQSFHETGTIKISIIDSLNSLTVGNGGLLTAVATMCTKDQFPKNGEWNVRWENLNDF